MYKIFDPKIKVIFYGLTIDSPKLTIDNLHMDFNVMLSNDQLVNTAAITIYNLKLANREALADMSFHVLELYVGYGDNTSLIFVGDITYIKNELDGPDRKSTIYCGDGMRFYEEVYFKKSYTSGTTYKTIIEDLCKASFYPYKIDTPVVPTSLSVYDDKLRLGRTYYGKIKDLLTQVCDDVGMHWYFLNGVLEVAFKGMMFLSDKEGVLIASFHGMIGSPTTIFRSIKEPKEVDVPNKKKKNKKNKDLPDKKEIELVERQRVGVEITSCINPYVKPGRLIKLVSNVHNSSGSKDDFEKSIDIHLSTDYICDTVNFYGNNYGGDFDMKILADYPIGDDEQNVKLITVR